MLRTPMEEFLIRGRRMENTQVPGSYTLEPNGDIIDPGRERRGCHHEELDDLYDHGEMPFAVYDRGGRLVIGGTCAAEHYHATVLALRDLLDLVDPSAEDAVASARASARSEATIDPYPHP